MGSDAEPGIVLVMISETSLIVEKLVVTEATVEDEDWCEEI